MLANKNTAIENKLCNTQSNTCKLQVRFAALRQNLKLISMINNKRIMQYTSKIYNENILFLKYTSKFYKAQIIFARQINLCNTQTSLQQVDKLSNYAKQKQAVRRINKLYNTHTHIHTRVVQDPSKICNGQSSSGCHKQAIQYTSNLQNT